MNTEITIEKRDTKTRTHKRVSWNKRWYIDCYNKVNCMKSPKYFECVQVNWTEWEREKKNTHKLHERSQIIHQFTLCALVGQIYLFSIRINHLVSLSVIVVPSLVLCPLPKFSSRMKFQKRIANGNQVTRRFLRRE